MVGPLERAAWRGPAWRETLEGDPGGRPWTGDRVGWATPGDPGGRPWTGDPPRANLWREAVRSRRAGKPEAVGSRRAGKPEASGVIARRLQARPCRETFEGDSGGRLWTGDIPWANLWHEAVGSRRAGKPEAVGSRRAGKPEASGVFARRLQARWETEA